MSADARIEANTIDNLLSVQPLHLSVGIQFIKIADTQCQISISEQFDSLCFRKSHEQGIDVLLNSTFLQEFCKSVCCLHQTSIIHISADNNT